MRTPLILSDVTELEIDNAPPSPSLRVRQESVQPEREIEPVELIDIRGVVFSTKE